MSLFDRLSDDERKSPHKYFCLGDSFDATKDVEQRFCLIGTGVFVPDPNKIDKSELRGARPKAYPALSTAKGEQRHAITLFKTKKDAIRAALMLTEAKGDWEDDGATVSIPCIFSVTLTNANQRNEEEKISLTRNKDHFILGTKTMVLSDRPRSFSFQAYSTSRDNLMIDTVQQVGAYDVSVFKENSEHRKFTFDPVGYEPGESNCCAIL